MIRAIMLFHILEADYRGDHRVWLRFNDGLEGEVNLSKAIHGEIFKPLVDPGYFAQFSLDKTLTWPNGADFAPEYLRDRLLETA